MTSIENRPAGWLPSRRRWLLAGLIVLLLAAAFRVVALPGVPPGLAQDEVLDADIALFIRRGEHALFFRHGYGHEPLYHYLAAPFAPLLGDNWLAIRLPSVYIGLLVVALTMRWSRREYGATTALVAGLGLAVSWWPILFSRVGIRPVLEPLLLLAAVWFWPLRHAAISRRGLICAAVAGFWLGLSMYSYTAARVAPLVPACLLILMAAAARLNGRRSDAEAQHAQMRYAMVVLAVCVAAYLPLGATLWANPELQQRLDQLEGPLTALRSGDVVPVARASLATLGVFSVTGDPRWTYGLPRQPLFDPLTAILFYVGLALALWRWRQAHFALLPVWLVVAMLPSALSPDAPSTVRLVGMLPVVYFLPGLAVAHLGEAVSMRRGMRAARALLVVALALLVFNVYRTVSHGFVRWPADLETRLRYQTVLWDIGRYWAAQDGAPAVVAETFYEPIDGDSLRRSVGRELPVRWVQTGGGVAGALVWPDGGGARLYVPEFAPLDSELARAGGLGEPVYRSEGPPSFAVYELPRKLPLAFAPSGATFGAPPSLGLDGYVMANMETALADGQLRVLSVWTVLAMLAPDTTLFVHLLDAEDAIVAQHDGLDAAAATLRPGDRLVQRHILPLSSLSPGDYRLVMGVYRRSDGLRLPMADGADFALLDHCRATAVDITCGLP